jgi:hypothetical protein
VCAAAQFVAIALTVIITGMFAMIASLTFAVIVVTSSGVSEVSWLKSKRRRSGATSEPRC